MPLYEYVLQFPDRTEEVRLSDRPLRIGERVLIGGHGWIVGAKVTGEDRVAARFLLQRPADAAVERRQR